MNEYTDEELARAKKHGEVIKGVAFDWWLVNSNGAGFALFREPHHTNADIEAAKAALRADRDVVGGIQVRNSVVESNRVKIALMAKHSKLPMNSHNVLMWNELDVKWHKFDHVAVDDVTKAPSEEMIHVAYRSPDGVKYSTFLPASVLSGGDDSISNTVRTNGPTGKDSGAEWERLYDTLNKVAHGMGSKLQPHELPSPLHIHVTAVMGSGHLGRMRDMVEHLCSPPPFGAGVIGIQGV